MECNRKSETTARNARKAMKAWEARKPKESIKCVGT